MQKNTNDRKIARNAIGDSILVVVVLFTFAIVSMFGYHIYTETTSGMDVSEMTQESQDLLSDIETGYPNWFNGAFLFAFVLLWIMVIVASLVVRTHPLFFLVVLIIFVFVIVLGAMLSNTWEEYTLDTDLGDTADSFTPVSFVLNNFVAFVIAIGATIVIALFGSGYFQ